MVSASTFYKYIGVNGYKKLLEKKIVPSDDKYIVKNIGLANQYKLNYTGNSTAYGKFIETKIIATLQGKDDTIKTFLPNLDIESIKKEFGNEIILTNDKKNLYDLICGNTIVDIKTYKKKVFSIADIRSFMIQTIMYYIHLNENMKNKINNIAIYNPIANNIISVSIKEFDVLILSDIYNKSLNIIDSYFNLKIAKPMKKNLFTFLGIYTNTKDICNLKRRLKIKENENKKLRNELKKLKKIILS